MIALRAFAAPALIALFAFVVTPLAAQSQDPVLDRIADKYVQLVLAVGQHDPDYVDAYHGPAEWKTEAEKQKLSLADIRTQAETLARQLKATRTAGDEMMRLRHTYLSKQIAALIARVEMLDGKKLKFDEESKALYDAVAPHHDAKYFQKILDEVAKIVPGSGPLNERYTAWRKQFIIPPDKLDAVFQEAIRGCRDRTLQHIQMPAGESFTVEYVKDKPWSGYNWYKGDYRSVIQVNTDLPIYIDRAIDLACHEGYPGHHVYNSLLEKNLLHDRGWREFSVYALFSPQSLIAEGSANYGIEVAFPGEERTRFEAEKLFPLAGLDPARAAEYRKVQELVQRLSFAGNEAARKYLNGEIDAKAAADWFERYALYSRPAAEQRVRFTDKYRAYVINYNLGQELVRNYVEKRAGGDANKRWDVFKELLSSPRLPSELK